MKLAVKADVDKKVAMVGLIESEKVYSRQVGNGRNNKLEVINREWTVFKKKLRKWAVSCKCSEGVVQRLKITRLVQSPVGH